MVSLLLLIVGCTAQQAHEVIDVIADPNTATVGEIVTDIGIIFGNNIAISIGVLLGILGGGGGTYAVLKKRGIK